MRTTFEAYLTKKENRFLLYLDEFHFSEIFNSEGITNIYKIKLVYYDHGIISERIIYEGAGKIPQFKDILNITGCKDMIDYIYINDDIEITFPFWDDIFILAGWETIIKYINGQKDIASLAKKKILNCLPNSQNIYFKLKSDILIEKRQMNLEEFYKLINDSYEFKYDEIMLEMKESMLNNSCNDEEKALLKTILDGYFATDELIKNMGE